MALSVVDQPGALTGKIAVEFTRTWSETPAEFHLQPISVFRPCGGLEGVPGE
jgi:hypothetical protein